MSQNTSHYVPKHFTVCFKPLYSMSRAWCLFFPWHDSTTTIILHGLIWNWNILGLNFFLDMILFFFNWWCPKTFYSTNFTVCLKTLYNMSQNTLPYVPKHFTIFLKTLYSLRYVSKQFTVWFPNSVKSQTVTLYSSYGIAYSLGCVRRLSVACHVSLSCIAAHPEYTNMVGISKYISKLTHCGLVMPYGDIDLGQHWIR